MLIPPYVMLATVVALLALLIGVIIASRRSRDHGERFGVKFTLSASAIVAGVFTIAAIWTLISSIASPALEMILPVRPQELSPIASHLGPAAIVSGTGAETITALVENVPDAARTMWAIGAALGILVPAAIAALIALACFQLLAGAPFAPALARATSITAIVVLVGGTASNVLTQFAGSITATEALRPPSAPGVEFAPMFSFTIPFWPIGAAFGLIALATIFAFGTRLQKDTEGLV